MFKRKNTERADELSEALASWREAMKRFETAADDEVRFVALEVEAARQKYIYLLNKRRYAYEVKQARAE